VESSHPPGKCPSRMHTRQERRNRDPLACCGLRSGKGCSSLTYKSSPRTRLSWPTPSDNYVPLQIWGLPLLVADPSRLFWGCG